MAEFKDRQQREKEVRSMLADIEPLGSSTAQGDEAMPEGVKEAIKALEGKDVVLPLKVPASSAWQRVYQRKDPSSKGKYVPLSTPFWKCFDSFTRIPLGVIKGKKFYFKITLSCDE